MTRADISLSPSSLAEARRLARKQARTDRIYLMLLSAGIAALGIVAIAGTMLTSLF